MNKLLELRLKNKLTVEQLAAKAEVSPTTITRLENGALKSHALTIAKIAEALGVEVSELGEFIKKEYRRKTSKQAAVGTTVNVDQTLAVA